MQKITHTAAGLALGLWLGLDPVYTTLGALLPDLDYICCHRKLLHNVWVLALAFLYSPALGFGVLSHLILDMLTVSGVALLWPIENKRIGIKIAKTGGIIDWALFVLFTALILCAFQPVVVGVPVNPASLCQLYGIDPH